MKYLQNFIFIILLLNFGISPIFTQKSHLPLNVKSNNIDSWESHFNRNKNLILEKNKKFKYLKDYRKFIEKRQNTTLQNIDEKHYFFDEAINKYIEQIFHNIIRSNPELQNENLKILISRYDWPNASFRGDGIVVINMGLIEHMENEDQIAAILCHELAHYYLDHLDKDYISHLEKINSKETRRKIKKIKRSSYNVYSNTEELLKEFVYDNRKHSRGHELEADSLGLVFLNKTNFEDAEFLNMLGKLDTIDKLSFHQVIDIKKVFDSNEYPFKNRWLTKEEYIFNGKVNNIEDWDLDSLKTHPECQKRIKVLKNKIQGKTRSDIDTSLQKIHEHIVYEKLFSLFYFENLGECLYHAILIHMQDPNDITATTFISECLSTIFHERLNHTSSHVIKKPSQSNHDNLKSTLIFIQNLRTSELAKINYYFMKKNSVIENNMANESFLSLFAQSASDAKKEKELKNIEKQFQKQFPDKELNLY